MVIFTHKSVKIHTLGNKVKNYYWVFFTLLPNTLQGVKVNFYTITLFHHEYFPFLFLVLHFFFVIVNIYTRRCRYTLCDVYLQLMVYFTPNCEELHLQVS